ncbi:MAG: hypothetical protein J6Z82_08175 [Schwartzia sp.]|nr:hypothetical protein [Schwartzia sp. (in: firmicutes)]
MEKAGREGISPLRAAFCLRFIMTQHDGKKHGKGVKGLVQYFLNSAMQYAVFPLLRVHGMASAVKFACFARVFMAELNVQLMTRAFGNDAKILFPSLCEKHLD